MAFQRKHILLVGDMSGHHDLLLVVVHSFAGAGPRVLLNRAYRAVVGHRLHSMTKRFDLGLYGPLWAHVCPDGHIFATLAAL